MKKVFYSVKLIGKKENIKLSGKVGDIAANTLFIPQYSTSKGTAYIRAFEDFNKWCHAKDDGSFGGFYSELSEYEGRTVQRTYQVWCKEIVD